MKFKTSHIHFGKYLIFSFSVLLILLSCNKERLPKMKIGYYTVHEERTYPNGTIESLDYYALGSYGDHKLKDYYFIGKHNNSKISFRFLFNVDEATVFYNQSSVDESFTLFIENYSVDKKHLFADCKRKDLNQNENYDTKVEFTFSEE